MLLNNNYVYCGVCSHNPTFNTPGKPKILKDENNNEYFLCSHCGSRIYLPKAKTSEEE